MKLVGGDAVDGGDGTAEDVICAVILFGGLEGVNVEWLFDDKDSGLVAGRVGIKRREVFASVDKGEGLRAELNAGMEALKSFRDAIRDARVGARNRK